MDSFESELNIIHQILKNEEKYTKLIFEQKQYDHYVRHCFDYHLKYNDNPNQSFINILINVLHNNTYVNEIYITISNFSIARTSKVIGFGDTESIKQIIKMKNWKSIYIYGESDDVLNALLSQQNQKLTKLKLSQIHSNGDKLLKLFVNTNRWFIRQSLTPSLKEFELCISSTPESNYSDIITAIRESNIKTLIFFDISCAETDLKFINGLLKLQIRNLYLKNSSRTNEYDLINNYTILNFTENGTLPIYAEKILDRNRNYAFTVLLCMNRKIIPRCVFKSLVLTHLFSL